jgi:hypothetical protein
MERETYYGLSKFAKLTRGKEEQYEVLKNEQFIITCKHKFDFYLKKVHGPNYP